ncbi:hypothetical protein Tco_1213012 [Tanacetum coccineum]
MDIINLCFAYDIFMFTRGDVNSARVIMEALDEFKLTSGLVPSIPKSTTYFCNVLNNVKIAILQILPFSEGTLLCMYFGAPLISSWLLNKDCKILVEKVKNRTGDWKNKSLSFAGMLQLCKSVLLSMQVYWASVLLIPKGIIYDIHQLVRGFLWCNGEYKRGKFKVAWEVICLPKNEGGLRIRDLDVLNVALMTTHIWNIISHKDSLWVSWIHRYKLQGRSFWEVPIVADSAWGWRKLLQLRELVNLLFSPLANLLTLRDISNGGFNMNSCVSDLVVIGQWMWPQAWILKAPNLSIIPTPNIDPSKRDMVLWRDLDGNLLVFLLGTRGRLYVCMVMRYYGLVWCGSLMVFHDTRFIFGLYYVAALELKTSFGNGTLVWHYVRSMADMDLIPPTLHQIVTHLAPMAKHQTAKSVIGRLSFAAFGYFIWIEHNNRLFKNSRKTPEEICDCIMVTIRLKLLTFRFKNKAMVSSLLAKWNMPSNFRINGT